MPTLNLMLLPDPSLTVRSHRVRQSIAATRKAVLHDMLALLEAADNVSEGVNNVADAQNQAAKAAVEARKEEREAALAEAAAEETSANHT